jgi:hypothetical protein
VLYIGEAPVTFQSIVAALREGATAEEIVARWPELSLADVYSVIGFYLRHQDELGDYLRPPAPPTPARGPQGVLSLLIPTRNLLRPLLPVSLLAWLPVMLLYGFAMLLTAISSVTIRQLTQDLTTVLDRPFYFGFISTLGNLLWAVAATVCLFTPLLLSRWIGKPWRVFLLFSGLMTLLLLFDDAFLLHDEILPNYLDLSGELYGVAYVLLMLFYLYRFRRQILHSNYLLLGIALACFGASAAVDLAFEWLRDFFPQRVVLGVEDGAKMLGIVTWLAYFVHLASTLLPASGLLPSRQQGPQ